MIDAHSYTQSLAIIAKRDNDSFAVQVGSNSFANSNHYTDFQYRKADLRCLCMLRFVALLPVEKNNAKEYKSGYKNDERNLNWSDRKY